jgi:hypothetical protein
MGIATRRPLCASPFIARPWPEGRLRRHRPATPEAGGKITVTLILGLAFIESLPFTPWSST